ncbi:MAG: LysR substrate-binding domain-containing protein [Paracoccaceae bacterium]
MELHQIRYALAAARALNFTRAATACNVSQPALTRAIRALEDQLGAPIFLREGRSVMLSEFGRSILPRLEEIATQADAARSFAESWRLLRQAPIRLGVMSTIGPARLSEFLAAFERRHDGVELTVTEAPAQELRRRLEAGELDLVIANPVEGFEGMRLAPLYEERYVVLLPANHPLGARDAVRLSELSGEPYVDRLACEMREAVTALCGEREVELYARFRSEREDWVQAMVAAGIGFAFMPEFAVTQPGLMQRPLIDPAVTRRIALASPPGRPHTPAMQALMRAAAAHAWPGRSVA